MIERPPSAHDLVGDNWPSISEVSLAGLSMAFVGAGTASQTAEQKAYTDGNAYQALLPEGFEKQVEVAFRVAGMAADIAAVLGKAAAETSVVAQGVMSAKIHITVTVGVAEALIAAKEAEIAALQAASLRPEVRAMRIQQLRNEIEQIINEAKSDIQAMYDGIYTPTAPPSPGLSPIVHAGPAANDGAGKQSGIDPVSNGKGDISALDNQIQGSKGDSSSANPSASDQQGARGQSDATQQGEKAGADSAPTQGEKPSGSAESEALSNSTQGSKPAAAGDSFPSSATSGGVPSTVAMPPSMGSPSASGGGSASGLSGAMPKMSGGGGLSSAGGSGLSSPGGLSSGGSGLSGLSGGGAPSAPAAPTPTQQFLSGVGQGFSSASPSTVASGASAAGAQPFKPAPGSTIPAGPPPASSAMSAPTSTSAGPVAAPAAPAASAAPMGGVPAAAGPMPMTAPPPAGTPSVAPPPAAPAPAAPVAPAPAAPAPAQPPPVMGLGGQNVAAKLAKMGTTAVGEGLRSSDEFNAAVVLVAALNDPAVGVVCEWACAVFQQPGETAARFVVASREGLSWIPPGVYMPDGVTVASLDESVPYATRQLWRGMKPPARVLAAYAKAIEEQPRIVVARKWLGLQGLFGRGTVLAADDETVVSPNPVLNPDGRHRLELASPDRWWAQVQAIPEADIATRIRDLAGHVAQAHDAAFGVHDADSQNFGGRALRVAAVEQIGRPGGEAVWHAVEQQMHWTRAQIMTAPIAAPEPLYEGWNNDLIAAEQMLRGWEVLWLAQRAATRATLADMTYAAAAALM